MKNEVKDEIDSFNRRESRRQIILLCAGLALGYDFGIFTWYLFEFGNVFNRYFAPIFIVAIIAIMVIAYFYESEPTESI